MTSPIRALRYYIGDVTGTDPFWGEKKAYLVINSLFYPGIATEKARIAEGKFLNPEILADEERLRGTYKEILAAFRPCGHSMKLFRVERFSDFQENVQAGHLISFTSTSERGFLRAYGDRRGIALERITIPAGTPCIPMAQALPFYAKADETEMLLPPMLRWEPIQVPLTKDEKTITDMDGQAPLCAAEVTVQGLDALPDVEDEPLPPGGNLAGQRVLCALSSGKEPEPGDVALYTRWKAQFIRSVLPVLYRES